MYITEHTLKDLEFHRVLEHVQELAVSQKGKDKILAIRPISDQKLLEKNLGQTDEYLKSFTHNNRIPGHYFNAIDKSINLLGIEDSFIEGEKLLDIRNMVETVHDLIGFFKKFNILYPLMNDTAQNLPDHPEIYQMIDRSIDQYGLVMDDASVVLKELRKNILTTESQLASSFSKAMQAALKAELLDDIKESVVDGRRVLAVIAKNRRKVKGTVLATSKTGSIVFILPESTQLLDQDLQLLHIQERDEVVRILKTITDELRPYKELLALYQDYLADLDVLKAKALYAKDIEAILPKITAEKTVNLVEAFHPLLLVYNRAKNTKTIPQSLHLNKEQQIIVISGPNAGGKSLTLKTIGLLQVMLQSGLLIPVSDKSELSFFDTILTDIGDNQSIENQLSTYSYRLNTMRLFLKKCNANTLFLIDEFGTGSDPELGGALAEVFLEAFYQKGAYGVITTHYTNIKALADQLEFAVNANMQFDKSSLQPLYELITGEAGSSFTFEVAQKIGIPFNLINRAKKKISSSKVRLDKTISKLQTERNILRQHTEDVVKEKDKAQERAQELVEKQQKIQDKLEQFQQLYDYNNKMLQLGRTFNQWLNRYFQTNNKKQLNAEFNKFVQQEKVKYAIKNPPKKQTKVERKKDIEVAKKEQEVLKKVEQEVKKEVEVISAQVQKEEKAKQEAIANYVYKVGDIVRVKDSWAQGSVEKIEKKKLLINYGTFTALVDKSEVELVKSK